VAVEDSILNRTGTTPVAPAGIDFSRTVTDTESLAPRNPARLIVAAFVESCFTLVGDPLVTVMVRLDSACEGTELRTPRPKAATATSAMRLKFVFVDICFLSLVVTRNFLVAASR